MKTLEEALPQLNIPDDLAERFKGSLVKRIVMNKARDTVRIELVLKNIVVRRDINVLEAYIKNQFFKNSEIVVRIEEAYEEDTVHVERPEGERNESQGGFFNGQYRRRKAAKKFEPEVGYGREFEGTKIAIDQILEEMKNITLTGKILSVSEGKELKNGSFIYTFVITDYTDSIRVKMFAKEDEKEKLEKFLKSARNVSLNGDSYYDDFEKELMIQHVKGIKLMSESKKSRTDDAQEKRVELHCHTKMSEMDGVSSVDDIIKQAANFGHKAIAITDHGVVHAFPEAMGAAEECARNGKPIKVIYGCEGYLVDAKEGDRMEDIMSAPRYHIILIAKNDIGRINLYKIVSESHLTYYRKRPRIPRFLLEQNREGIIVGSACEAGELMRSIVEEKPEEKIEEIASFYDYLEVQPIGNNKFMLASQKHPNINSDDDLRALNDRIIALGEKLHKPVVATCDVHFLNPEDEIYRRIIMAGIGFSDADNQPPLYLHTTEEMLEEFSYLGEEKAKEIVIDNTNLIADCCETITPVRFDKCPPIIEGSEDNLRNICYEKAHRLYGDPLPEIVKTRLDKELDSIIGNGYSVMYIFAQMLIKQSMDNGYLVGSRGSVGSSFAATMADITEVNPLPPHYRCTKCKYSEFGSEDIEKSGAKTGFDLPNKTCPNCGEKLYKDGIDIPFETFLGFKGDKEPDIDLNFSGEYQSKAHAYTVELFGNENTFKAGTISGVADKTAFGFVMKYFEEKGVTKRRCEIDRIKKGCENIKRTTGQHPGGMVVMPKGESIYSFTPIQHPANDMKSNIITTHFDYHKIEQNLLKFDILGHDDPTMMKWLSDMTGVDPTKIELDNPVLYSIFQNTDALGITSADIDGTLKGTLGIPEFNTDFAMQMLDDAKPTGFADLINIAGLAHGTDVWLNNARDLILSGKATLQTAICTRDEIMIQLIDKGLDSADAFAIMESVRKGKVASKTEKRWDDWKRELLEHNVPKWYIESCEKIKYMFPKAHAAAYVMMGLRVAYFKIYHPLEFYAAYFAIRANGFDYEKVCMGYDKLMEYYNFYKKNYDNLSNLERDAYNKTIRVAQEMYARGYEFMPIDIYQADAFRFKIIDGKIMPALISIAGLGEKVAVTFAAEAAKAKFLSKEDISSRTKASGKIVDYMDELGLLGNMPKSNQMSLFDMILE